MPSNRTWRRYGGTMDQQQLCPKALLRDIVAHPHKDADYAKLGRRNHGNG